MKKNVSRILAIVLCLGMMLGLASCFEWDYEVDGVTFETPVEYNGLNNDIVAVSPGAATTDGAATVSAGGSTTASGSTAASASSSSSSASGSTASASASALEIYKTAANKVKSTASSATRTKEVITTISGSIPSAYQTFGFKEGTDSTPKKVEKSDLKKSFCVEGQSYTCNLSESDVKSSSISKSGSNTIVNITVKDDDAGTYSRSKKCVSTISIPIGTWTCKGVQLRGVIDANGRLVSLYYKMPTYVTSGGNAFAFALEQYWTISY